MFKRIQNPPNSWRALGLMARIYTSACLILPRKPIEPIWTRPADTMASLRVGDRKEFSRRTKLEAFQRSGGKCESCTARLQTGGIEYDHIQPCTMGGDNGLRNCRVLCKACHRLHTGRLLPIVAKSNRQRSGHLGIKKRSSRPLPFGKASRFKKTLSGKIVER